MMKSSTYKLLLCMVVSFFVAGSAFATDRYVNGQVGGETMGLYATLQAALDDAVPGDVIYVYGAGEVPPVPGADPGLASYPGVAIVYDNNISILGVGNVLFQGTGSGNCITASGYSDIVIHDIAIDGYAQGLRLGVTNGDLAGLTITGCQYGLYILGSTAGLTCDGNTFNNNNAGGYAVVLQGADVSITGCTMMGNASGMLIGAAAGMDVSGNTIKNSNNYGIRVTGYALGAIVDNNVQLNDVGIEVTYDYSGGALRDLEIYSNCLGYNTTYAARDVNNTWASPYAVCWHASGGPGNYYGTFYTGTPSDYYPIPGAGNWGKFPLTATNNPVGPATVPLGETFTVDFVFSIPTNCDPYQQLKTCHFVVGYDQNLMQITGVEAGDYLPEVEMITNPVQGAYEIDLTALGDGHHATTHSGILATATFVATSAAVGVDQITVSSNYDDKDGVDITVTSAPLDIEVEDDTPPEIRVANLIDSPTDDATYSPAYPLTLEWTVWDDFNLEYFHWQIKNDAGVVQTGYSWAKVTAPDPHPDGAGEVSGTNTWDLSGLPSSGTYYLELWLRDGPPAYNEDKWTFSKSGALTFTFDMTPPGKPSMTLSDNDGCADPGLTSSLDLLADISADPDAYEMRFQQSGETAEGWLSFADPHVYTIFNDVGDGNYDIRIRVRDIYLNQSTWSAYASIDLDRVAPDKDYSTADFGFSVPNKTKTLTRNAAVDHWGDYGSTEYAYSVDNVVDGNGVDLTCDDANWQAKIMPPPTTFPFTLPDGPDGNYEVCMAVRDGHGNVSGVVCDDIELDRTAPCFASYSVDPDNGMPCDNNYTFDITMTFTNDPHSVRFWVEGGTTGKSGWIPVTGDPFVYTYSVLPADKSGSGVYVIKADVKDALGNICDTPGSDDIQIELGKPNPGVAEINGASAWPWTYATTDVIPVTFPGASADATQAMVSENDPAFTGASWQDIGSTTITLTGPQCGWRTIYYMVRDCGGNVSTFNSAVHKGLVKYDIVAPVIDNFNLFNNAVVTKNVNMKLYFTITENCNVAEFMAVEGSADFSGGLWQTYTGSPATDRYLLVDQSDGLKEIFVKVRDDAGNESNVMSDDIYLDRTPPTGTITLVANPTCGAAAGYTCTLDDNIVEFSGVDGDVVAMEIENCNGSGNMIVDPFDPTTASMVWDLAGSPASPGTRCVHVKFKDAANNWTASWIDATIIYDPTPPTWGGGMTMTARPTDGAKDGWGHSIHVGWSAHPDAQYYGLNWQRTTDHPDYDAPFPAYPPTIADEFFGPHDLTGTETVFETVELPGIFFLSLFVQDMAGNWSTNKLTAATTNFYLGDFGETAEELAGGLEIADFEELKFNYFAPGTHPYDPLYDIGPTSDGSIYGYPTHVGDAVQYEDLVVFTRVYDVHALAGKGATLPSIRFKPFPSEALILSAEMPSEFHTGQEFDAAIRINDPSPVKVMSLTFDYDTELLEAVSIQPGDMFAADNAFLLNCVQGSSILMDGTILGADKVFEGTDVAVIRFRAKNSGSFEFTDPKMIFYDRSYEDLEVLFSNVASQALPGRFALAQNYPNPFNPSTTIELALPSACEWRCDIYNVAGQIVKSVSGYNEAGTVPIMWDGTDAVGSRVASGIYFYRITADSGRFVETKKMVLMK